MLKTPIYKVHDESVYPPSEDTFILLDALEIDQKQLLDLRPLIVLEVGSGSGIVSTFLRQFLMLNIDKTSIVSFCTDLNVKALECSRLTAELNTAGESLQLIKCDLFEPLAYRLEGSVDVLLFNPPYVPSDKPAMSVKDFYYAGGPEGRCAINRILPKLNQILSPNGVFYLVALKANNINDICKLGSLNGLLSKVVLERRCGIEYLYVLKFWRLN